jgi:Galactose oxidase, central domain/Kelch motif
VRWRAGLAALVAVAGAAAVAIALLTGGDEDSAPPAGESAAGEWGALSDSPLQRTEVATARIGPHIYVVGGFIADGGNANQVARYDIRSDEWSLVAPMPAALNHAAAASAGGKLYVHGGYGAAGDLSGETNHLYRYDLAADSWTQLADSPTARAAHALQPIEGRLYAAGGAQGGDRALANLEVYDIARDRWSASPGMGVAREHVGSAVSGGRLFVIAGRAGGRNLAVVESYDPAAGSWSRERPVSIARSGFGAAAVGDRIVVAGGEQLAEGDETIAPVEVYDPLRRRWERLPPISTPRHGLGVVSEGRRVYALEGGPEPGLSFSGEAEFLDLPQRAP